MNTTTKPAWINGCECPSCDIARELLESLKEMTALARVKWGNIDPDANALFAKAQAAISKAKGEM